MTLRARLRAGVSRVAAALPVMLRDLAGLAGFGAVTYGVWQIHVPAGWIVGGVMLMIAVWLTARRP